MSSTMLPDGSDFRNEEWVMTEAQEFCFNHPDDFRCERIPGAYEYDVSLAANVIFLVIFLISMLSFIGTYLWTRRGGGFCIALTLGTLCEVIGYIGRIMGARNAWNANGFLIQICCLTIGPAFMAAGVYLCLRRIVSVFGPEHSRIPPPYYTRIFIPCDIVALLFQALGGGIASVASNNNEDPSTGSDIMIVGLAFQVATGFGFCVTASDFALRLWRRYRASGSSILSQDPDLVRMRGTLRFRGFLVSLGLAAFLILWRSVFRVAELAQGWDGELMGRQDLFIAFEGVLIAVACVILNIFHPALCGKELLEAGEPRKTGGGRRWLRIPFVGRNMGEKNVEAREMKNVSVSASEQPSGENSQVPSVRGYSSHDDHNNAYPDQGWRA